MKEEKPVEENDFNKSSKYIQELLKKKKLLKRDSNRLIDNTYILSEGNNKSKDNEEELKTISSIKDNVAVLLNQYEQQYLISQSVNISNISSSSSGNNNTSGNSGGGSGFKSLFKRFNKKEDKPLSSTKDISTVSNEMNKNIDKNYMFIVSGVQCKSKLPKLDNMIFNTLDELDIYLKSNNNNNNNNNNTVDHHKVLLELLCEIILPMITVEGVLRIYDNKIIFEGTKLGGLTDLSQQALAVTKYIL